MTRTQWFILGALGSLVVVCLVCVGCLALSMLVSPSGQTNPGALESEGTATPPPTVGSIATPTQTPPPTAGSIASPTQASTRPATSAAKSPTITIAPTRSPSSVVTVPTPTRSTVAQELVNLTSPVAKGAQASITVRTSPGSSCSITVYYKSGASHAAGLEPETAGNDGLCSWTWKVGTNTTPGTWRIVVTTGATSLEYAFVVQ